MLQCSQSKTCLLFSSWQDQTLLLSLFYIYVRDFTWIFVAQSFSWTQWSNKHNCYLGQTLGERKRRGHVVLRAKEKETGSKSGNGEKGSREKGKGHGVWELGRGMHRLRGEKAALLLRPGTPQSLSVLLPVLMLCSLSVALKRTFLEFLTWECCQGTDLVGVVMGRGDSDVLLPTPSY